MANLTIVNQEAYRDNILPKMLLLKEQLNLRSEIWAKLDMNKKRKWVAGNKDPLMKLAFQMGQYFKENFPELLEDYNG